MPASTAEGEEFLVWIRNELPASTAPDERATLVAAERTRVAELVQAGIVKRLWRVAGRRENVGIFVAPTPTALHAALESLPMYPHLKITVIPLAEHVSDPGSAG